MIYKPNTSEQAADIWLEHENKELNAQELFQRNHLYVKTRKRNDSIDTAFGQ